MKSFLSFFIVLIPFSISGAAWGDEPPSKVRISMDRSGEIWVGQRVPLVVELLASGYFSGSPVFDLPRVPGLLILPPAGSPSVGSEDIGGTTYTVQRHELMVFSSGAGTISIPPFKVRFGFKHQPLDHDSVEAEVSTESITFTARQPPGSDAEETLITSGDLAVTESWKPEPGKQVKAGDAFVRTIVWTASDVPGMAFPPFDPGHIEGLGIYPRDPAVYDTSDRGTLRGQRGDTVTYVCKTGGHFVIPAQHIRWWDPVEKQMKQTDFPERTFDVTAPPVPPVKLSVRITRMLRDHWLVISGSLVIFSLAAVGVFLAWESIVRFFKLLLPRHLAPLNPS
ncbi:MAG: BatD family protein [Verrucomicrobiota bacterium]